MTGRSTSSVPLGAAVSEHMREQPGAGDEPGARSRVSTSKEPSRPASEWVDVDEDRPRRRRRSRQPVYEDSKTDRLGKTKHSSSVNADIGRFLPKLSRILESADTNSRNTQSIYGSRPSNRDIEEKSRTSRHRESSDSNYRHAVRRKVTGAQRRSEPVPRINTSLVSLLSSLTTISDRSSGSNSTITQRSYDRQRGVAPRTDTGGSGKPRTAKRSNLSTMSRSKSPNVFDYMEDPSVVDEHDDKSAKSPASSVSSRYQGSDTGSSEGPATPSSRSTMPSPTTSRNPGVSVAELRRKYDQDFNGATTQPVGGSPGMVSSTLSAQKERYSNVASDQRSDNGSTASPSMASSVPELGASRRQSSHTSLRALDAEQRLKQREQEMREHMAFTQHPYAYEFTSPPEASDHDDPQAPDPATPATHQALQHYIHHPVPTRPIPAKVVRSTPSPSCTTHPPAPNPPHVPEAPDLTKTTLAGYELLATHLAPPASTTTTTTTTTAEPHLTPLYRKFTHLHHRILLHLQDELAEMESQLRVLDEIVAQTYTAPAPQSTTEHPEKQPQPQSQPQRHPASRRAESHPHTPPIFAHRTALLGRIFLKKQQYHAALRDFAALERDSRPAEAGEIDKYRAFLKARAPVCEGEAAFLARGDLVVPLAVAGAGAGTGRREREGERDGVLWEQAAFLAALLVLPLVISVALPGLGARVAATGLLGAGAGLVVWGARVRGRG